MYVGSMNMDPRSVALNTEMGVVVENEPYIRQSHQKLMNSLYQNAYQVVVIDEDVQWKDHVSGEILTSEPDASIWLRFSSWMAGILPIEDQL
jgi:putative cardiolipin synthase